MDRSALEKMLNSGTDNAMLRYTLGLVCFQEKDYMSASQHLQKAIELDDSHSASWKIYGKTLAALEQPDKARSVYEQGIAVAEAKGDIQAAKEMKVFLKRLQ